MIVHARKNENQTARGGWTIATPCPKCGRNDNCKLSADGAKLWCGRVAEGSIRENAGGQYLHILIDDPARKTPKPVTAAPTGEIADVDTRHEVYSALLAELPLANAHRENLLARKVAQPFTGQYATLSLSGRSRIVRRLRDKFSDATLLTVPGFILKSGTDSNYITLAGSPGLLIAIRDTQHRITSLKIRRDEATGGNRYRWLTSKRHGGPSPTTDPHVPRNVSGPTSILRLTEGPLKAETAAALTDIPTIAADAVGSWARTIPVAQALGAKVIRLAFDRDCETNADVAAKLICCFEGYDVAGFDVQIETWPNDYKGIDDALVAGATIELLTGDDARAYLARLRDLSPEKAAEAAVGGRVEVEITADEYLVNAAAVGALAADESVYQRAGRLVHVISGAPVNDGLTRPDDAPRIVGIPHSIIREKLTQHAYFFRTVESQDGPVQIQKPPPESCVRAVAERGQWEGIRPLTGTTDSPVMRRDGSILSAPGYDAATGLTFAPRGTDYPPVPERPTMNEVRAAVALLTDVVSDFPFERAAHRSSWLAFLLTALARHAFDGPAPLFLADANTRGSGKTKILELVSVIVTGRDFARLANSADDSEWDKRILSAAFADDQLILIDNIGAELGCPSLDAALTATSWRGRLLGKSEMVELPLSITWCASGNNVTLAADTSRRVCPIRLSSPLEHPEERTGFRHPNLLQYVRENRPALLCAALTVLRGFHAAGRPDQGLPPWGSFDGWSDLVRQAIVWAAEPDPGETRAQLRAFADRGGSALRSLIAVWPSIDPEGTGLTAAELCRRIENEPDSLRAARAALFEFCGSRDGRFPSHVSLGKRLSRVRGRIVDSKSLDCQPTRDGTMLWFLRGMIGIAGGFSTTLRGESPHTHRDTSCMRGETIQEGAETSPQSPPSPAPADWLGSVPLTTVVHPTDLIHKSPSCKSCRGWRLIGGGLHCFSCWPPADPLAVERPEPPAPPPAPPPVMDDDADLL